MTPDRILLTTDGRGSGCNATLDLARALAGHGVEVIVAALGPAADAWPLTEARAVDGLVIETRPAADADDRWLLALEHRHRPDLVQLTTPAHAALPWRAPVVVAAHDCPLARRLATGAPRPAGAAREALARRRGLRAARLVIAPTLAALDTLERRSGPLPPSAVIPHGVDPARFAPAAKHPHVLAAAADHTDGLDTLACAAAHVPWPVHLVGDAPPLPAVVPQGPLPRRALAAALARAALFAAPMRYTPFGLTTLEAATAGCALVVGDVEAMRELWGDAAAYVPPGDADALTATLTALIDDPARREALAARARARAARYTLARMTERHLTAYARLLARAPRRARPEPRLLDAAPA